MGDRVRCSRAAMPRDFFSPSYATAFMCVISGLARSAKAVFAISRQINAYLDPHFSAAWLWRRPRMWVEVTTRRVRLRNGVVWLDQAIKRWTMVKPFAPATTSPWECWPPSFVWLNFRSSEGALSKSNTLASARGGSWARNSWRLTCCLWGDF